MKIKYIRLIIIALGIILMFTTLSQAQTSVCITDRTDLFRDVQQNIAMLCRENSCTTIVADGIEFNGHTVYVSNKLEVYGGLTNFGEAITDIDAFVLGLIVTKCDGVLMLSDETLSLPNNTVGNVMFPNPADKILNIVGNNINDIEILDIHGKSLFKKLNPVRYNRIRLNLESGLYFVRINKEIKKLIVK